MKIKRLALTAVVRAKLEYGSQVWYCNSAQRDALESIQHTGCVWILRTNAKSSRLALRTILGLPSLLARRDMMKLFYYGILLSKSFRTWPRHCFEVKPDIVNKIKGRSQKHWYTRLQDLTKMGTLGEAHATVINDLSICGGQLQEYVCPVDPEVIINPVKRWRKSIRLAIDSREIDHFREEARHHSSLQILAVATAGSWLRAQNLLRRSPHPINWIRIRLLCGTSSLNSMMSRITRGARPKSCPMCDSETETVVHFLRECRSAECIAARTHHFVRMQPLFGSLTPIQQSAFILGCAVDTGKGEVVATRDEDFINFTLVESLWEYRKVVLNSRNSCLDLTEGDSSPPARRSHPIDGGGVEAHGSNATLSS